MEALHSLSRQPLGRRTNQDVKMSTAKKKQSQQLFGDRTATENATPSFRRAVRATLTPRSMLTQEIQLSGDTSFISLSSPVVDDIVLPTKGVLTTTTTNTTKVPSSQSIPDSTENNSVESKELKPKSSIFKSTLQKFTEAPRQSPAPVKAPPMIVRRTAPALVIDTSDIPQNLPPKPIPTSQGDASLDAALKGLMEAVMTPPSTTKSAGVCMDLSSMFCEAAQGTGLPKKPPIPRKQSSFVPGRSSHKKSRSGKGKTTTIMSPIQLMPPTATTSADEKKNKEAWASQQEETFTTFLNYILCPPDEADTLQWHQRYAKARLKARAVFVSMSTTRDTLHSEISTGRVTIRTDKDIHADLTVRAEVMELLCSFQPQWLRLGLETMLGDMPNKMNMKEFIVDRLLSDRKLLKKYTRGKCKVPSGRFEKDYKQEMRQLVLYRVLVLFFFLEEAKQAHCFDQPLFNANSKFKAMKDILNALSRIVLHGQGNFARHLERQGLKVVYQQSVVDELDFRITNLATDLRDGTRLARWAEELLHLPRFELIQKLEIPAGSRLQKIRNLQRVLGQLMHLVPDNKVLAHHIVDGYRDRSCLDDLLPVARVHQEIERLERLRSFSTFSFLPPDLKGSLLIWADLVCRRFGRSVQNWTSSFFDGVAVCILIHYYHPRLLRIEDIDYSEHSAQENAKRANKVLVRLGGMPHQIIPAKPSEESMLLALTCLCSRLMSSSAEDRATRLIQFAYRAHSERKMEQRRKEAARLIWSAWETHRDVYYASQRCIYSKAVAVLENFVLRYKNKFSQLRQSREQTHQKAIVIQRTRVVMERINAAVIIQLWWTRMMVKQMIRDDAAVTIQHWWRRNASQLHQQLMEAASTVIQKHWKSFRARRHNRMVQSACKIQRIWKIFLAQINLQLAFIDIITVQAVARRFLARQEYKRRLQAVLLLQEKTKCHLLARKARKENQSARCIQIAYLRYRVKVLIEKDIESRRLAATQIQGAWRRHVAISRVATLSSACLRVQSAYRRQVARSHFHMLRQHAIVIQNYWRSAIARKHFRHADHAACCIQATWRRYSLRDRYLTKLLPTVELGVRRLQARIRGMRSRNEILRLHNSASVLQAWTRQKSANAKYQSIRLQIIFAQAICRSFIATKRYSLIRSSTIRIQSCVRKWLSCRLAENRRANLLMIQCACRVWLAKLATNMMVVARNNEIRAAQVIQCRFRGYLVQRETMNVRKSAVHIQRVFRGHVARIDYYIELVDIVIVQSVARMWMARRAANERRKSIIRIQSAVRMYSMKARFSQSRAELSAAVVLQRFVRGYLARVSIRRGRAATKLQKTWRCYTKHVDYMMAILSCIQIQAAARRFIAVSKVAQRRADIVRLQSSARRSLVVRHLRRQSSSAIKIQAALRMFFLRSKFLVRKVAITQVQRVVRGHIQRADLALQHFAATQIQGAWRAYVSVTYFICMELSAVTIQSLFRGWLGRKHAESCRDDHLALTFCKERSARIIQCSYREHSRRMLQHTSARKIALSWKQCRMQKAFRKMTAGFVQLQGAFRGFSVRAKDPLAASRMQRVQVAKINSTMNPDLRLCNKTKRALIRLRKSSGLSDILDSIQFLERATRYSRQCCTAFTQAGAPDILFSLVRSCNRSLPHVELLEWILLTLSNVARFDELLPSVATITGVRIFLDLLQMFRDKEVVFSLSVALLLKSVRANVDLMGYCKSKENKKRLQAVYDVVSSRRAHILVENSNRNRVSRQDPKHRLVLARNQEASHAVAQRLLHKILQRMVA